VYTLSTSTTPVWSSTGYAIPTTGIATSAPQFSMTCTGYDRYIYIMGGGDATFTLTSAVWRLDVTAPAASAWLQRASMPILTYYAAADESGGKIYLCGGFDSRSSLQTYAITGNTWSVTPMPVQRYYLSVSALKPSSSSCPELIFAMGADREEPIISVYNTGTLQWFDGRDLFGTQFAFPNPGGPWQVLQGTMTTSDRQIFAVGTYAIFKTQIP